METNDTKCGCGGMVDTLASNPSAFVRTSSSLVTRTTNLQAARYKWQLSVTIRKIQINILPPFQKNQRLHRRSQFSEDMMLKFIASTCLALSLAGCVETQQTSMTGPAGQTISVAKCSKNAAGCYQKAAETCSGPYQVLDSYSKAGGLVADVIPGPVTWYYMTYQCGPTDGRMPTFPFRGPEITPQDINLIPNRSYQAPTTTTCNRIGNSVTCNSY